MNDAITAELFANAAAAALRLREYSLAFSFADAALDLSSGAPFPARATVFNISQVAFENLSEAARENPEPATVACALTLLRHAA